MWSSHNCSDDWVVALRGSFEFGRLGLTSFDLVIDSKEKVKDESDQKDGSVTDDHVDLCDMGISSHQCDLSSTFNEFTKINLMIDLASAPSKSMLTFNESKKKDFKNIIIMLGF